MKNIIKQLFCRHAKWEIQPTYVLLHHDRCKECGKLRKTVGNVESTQFNMGTFRIK